MRNYGAKDWPSLQTAVDLGRLPVTVDQGPKATPKVTLLFAFGLVLMTGLYFLSGVLIEGAAVLSFNLFPVGIALTVLIVLVAAPLRRRRVTFDEEGVTVESRGLLGLKTWSLPYEAFKGVLYREELLRRQNAGLQRQNTGSGIFQVIELLHEKRNRCVLLYVCRTAEVPRDRWEGYARRLGLPALEIGAEGINARAAGDLDKSLKDLAAEGKVDAAFDLAAAVPRGLRLERPEDGRLRVLVTATRISAKLLGFCALVGFALCAFAFTAGLTGIILLPVGLLFAGLAWFMFQWDRNKPRVLEIDRLCLKITDDFDNDLVENERIAKFYLAAVAGQTGHPAAGKQAKAIPFPLPGTQDTYRTEELALQDIESVKVAKVNRPSGPPAYELVITGDKHRFNFGRGLSMAALNWLKDFLTAAIATA